MAGKSMTPFYIGLGALAVAGGAFILSKTSREQPPLNIEAIAPVIAGPRGVAIGPDSAPVEIMEFSDFECPWCGQYANLQMPDIKERLLTRGNVRWRFMHYPLGIHSKGPFAHLAASCANEQGRFWEMHDIIYQNQPDWSAARDPLKLMAQYAERAGVERTRYNSCIEERRTWGRVLADKALGDSLAAGMGTPTFFINGQQWAGDRSPTVDQLIPLTDSLAARARAARGRQPAAR